MLVSTTEAAQILGTSRRTVLNALDAGRLDALRIGGSFAVFERQVFALKRMVFSGRNWREETVRAALDLLSGCPVSTVRGSQLSRLKARLRNIGAGELAGHVLGGRTTLYRAEASRQQTIGSALAEDLGLGGYGLSVIVESDAEAHAERLGLIRDPEGNTVALDGAAEHTAVIEALALTVYGGTRERAAARAWIEQQKHALLGS